MTFIRDRLSFWTLTTSYPILAILFLKERWLENQYVAFGAIITFTSAALYLALHASLRIKMRSLPPTTTPKEIGDLVVDFIPLAFTIAFAQVFIRDVAAIGSQPDFYKHFGYHVSRDVDHILQWMGSIWAVLIAYCVKYHWDAIVGAMELSLRASNQDEPPSKTPS